MSVTLTLSARLALGTHVSRVDLRGGVGPGLGGHVYRRRGTIHEQVRLHSHLQLHALVEQLQRTGDYFNVSLSGTYE